MMRWIKNSQGRWYAFGSGTDLDGHDFFSDIWTSDDHRDEDEDLNPWNGNGKLYSSDSPGVRLLPTDVAGVYVYNFREWVDIGISVATDQDAGQKNSDYMPWHLYISVSRDEEGHLETNTNFGANEIMTGNLFWGVVPSFAITSTTLPQGKIGQQYLATLAATGGTPPYYWQSMYGELPPGLTLSNEGIISGTISSSATPKTYVIFLTASDSSAPSVTSAPKQLKIVVTP